MPVLDGDSIAELARHGQVRRIPTGFPSPAEDGAEASLDLHTLLVKRPASTFFVSMVGDAMIEAGIYGGDILVVDRSLTPVYTTVVVAAVDGEMVVRHWCPDRGEIVLLPAHPDFSAIRVAAGGNCRVWGVVTYAIHAIGRGAPPRHYPPPPADAI